MPHVFRHHEYVHIKPVLILCLIAILLFVGGALLVHFATKPQPPPKDTKEE